MPVVPIRDVSPQDLARSGACAARMGLSRTEYLRRRLHQGAARAATPVTADDRASFATRCADLGDAEVLRRAWS